MNYQSAEELAKWMLHNQPALFAALKKNADARQALSGFTDFFSAIGTGLASATKQVASFVASPEGVSTLTGLAAAYMNNKNQKDALNLQIKLAQAGQPLAPIANSADPYTGTTQAYYYANGQAPQLVTPQLTNYLMPPKTIKDYVPWIAGGVGLLLLAVLAARA